MSDNIPFEMQVEIIERVPVKALLKFRSVSKQWKSLIDSPKFATDYCVRKSRTHLLIRYIPFEKDKRFPNIKMFKLLMIDPVWYYFHSIRIYDIPKYKYVTVADDNDDVLDQHQFPKCVNNLRDSRIVGCSYGLFCLYGYDPNRPCPSENRKISYMVVLWNPWIRKCVNVFVPNVLYKGCGTILGFGVSPQTKDPKIVKINNPGYRVDTSVHVPLRVEIFTLRSGIWKSPSCNGNNIPFRNSIRFCWSQVALDGFIYWHAFERINVDGRCCFHNLIMSFDLSSEGFEEVCLPDNLACLDKACLSISKRMESVVVLEIIEPEICVVWMMGQGVTKSFTKLFTVSTLVSPFCMVRGFMNNGEPIVDHGSHALFAYDSCSEGIKDLGFVGHSVTFSVKSYMESLLLIDQ